MLRMVIESRRSIRKWERRSPGIRRPCSGKVSRLGGGKALDYAEIEQATAEGVGRRDVAGHRARLQSLDIDVPADPSP